MKLYLHLNWNGWDYVATPIFGKKELHSWLEDNSLKERDFVFEIKKRYVVTKWTDDKLCLKDAELITKEILE